MGTFSPNRKLTMDRQGIKNQISDLKRVGFYSHSKAMNLIEDQKVQLGKLDAEVGDLTDRIEKLENAVNFLRKQLTQKGKNDESRRNV